MLSNLTSEQTDLISEICFNLLHVVEVDREQEKLLKKQLKSLKELSRVNKSRKCRQQKIKKHIHSLLKILESIKGDILNFANEKKENSEMKNK